MFRKITRCEKRLMGLAFVAAFMAFLAYIPSLKNGFINWDDNLYVYGNPAIRVFGLRFLSAVFTEYVAYNWHPLTIISYALDYRLMGLNPLVYHLTNIIFHAFNTFLVAVLTFRLLEIAVPAWTGIDSEPHGATPALVASSVTALLFGLHPLHVESVVWISERKDVLYSFFFLLSTLSYLKYASSRGYGNYALALLFFALSIMSKPMAVSLPIVLLILDYYPLNRFAGFRNNIWNSRWLFLEKLPFFIVSLLSAVLTMHAQKSSVASMNATGFAARIFTSIHAYIFYLYKMIIPVDLAPFYPYPEHMKILSNEYIISSVIFFVISLLILLASEKYRVFKSAWLYYLITLLPVIGIVQVGAQAAADRYTYLPGLGPFMLAGIGAGRLFQKAGKREGWFASSEQEPFTLAVIAIIGISLSLFSFLTITQEALWKDPMTLWNYELEKYPGAFVAYHNRGVIYMDRHDYANAIEDLNKAIAFNHSSNPVMSYYTRGHVYMMTGKYLLAIKDFNITIALNPEFLKPHNDTGVAYGRLGQYDKALKEFNKAIELDPEFAEAFANRGNVFLKLGEYSKAIKDFNLAITLNPEFSRPHNDLGVYYGNLGQYDRAIKEFTKAIELDPKFEEAFNNRGYTYSKMGEYNKAIEDIKKALEFDPGNSGVCYNLGSAYLKIGDAKQAKFYFEKASSMSGKINAPLK